MTTLINSINNNLVSGLKYVVYSGNMGGSSPALDDPNFFKTASLLPVGTSGTSGSNNQGIVTEIPNIVTGTGNFITSSTTPPGPDNFSVQWLGYFKSDYTGTWTFYTTSDDCSYIWIGSTAITGYTTSNPVVNNGGPHSSQERSGTINLVSGEYYPIRIQYGEGAVDNIIVVSFSNPTLTKTTNGNGYFFNQNNGVIRP